MPVDVKLKLFAAKFVTYHYYMFHKFDINYNSLLKKLRKRKIK